MSVSDPIADMLTKIRNASTAQLTSTDIQPSKLKVEIIKILKTEGFIKNFKRVNESGREEVRVFLKYDHQQRPVIRGIRKISTPGRRVYSGYRKMPRVLNGYGTLIVSTSTGVTTGRKALERQVGGELICSVW